MTARYNGVINFDDPFGSAFAIWRIPRPAPKEDNDKETPGHLCWGEVGTLPTAELAETVGFEIVKDDEKWTETSRVATDEEIVNPDDPDSKVIVNRPTQVNYNKTSRNYGLPDNTAYDDPQLQQFEPEPIEFSSFLPEGVVKKRKSKVTVTIANRPRSA